MNVTKANRRIAALNQIVEGVVLLAQVIEEEAWDSFEDHAGMPGVRPLATAQLVQSPIQPADPPWGDKSEPEPAVTPNAPQVSLEQVRSVLADLTSQGMTAQVKALITQAGAEKLSAVDPGKYGCLLEQAKGLSDA